MLPALPERTIIRVVTFNDGYRVIAGDTHTTEMYLERLNPKEGFDDCGILWR